jgi:hypothetical protein
MFKGKVFKSFQRFFTVDSVSGITAATTEGPDSKPNKHPEVVRYLKKMEIR